MSTQLEPILEAYEYKTEFVLHLLIVDFLIPLIPACLRGSYSQLYKDVRAAVDLCHRDGTLKEAVANEPSK